MGEAPTPHGPAARSLIADSLRAVRKVYVARRLLPGPIAELDAAFATTVHDSDWPPARRDLLAAVAGMDGAVLLPTDRVDDELLEAAGSALQIVANHAVGFDNVNVEACSRRGVVVTNTPGVLTAATAELTIALMLDVTRRVTEGDHHIRAGNPWILAPAFMLGPGLVGRRLGIVGLGRIGLEVARLAKAFGMTIAYSGRRDLDGVDYERVGLSELLAASDIVSLHCPLTPETHHLIDSEALAQMQPHAVLVNTARGAIVDEGALVAALRTGRLAGAGLDVYEREPRVHPGLLGLANVVLAPHLGSATPAAREAMGRLCVEALRAVLLERRLPENALNPEALTVRAL